MPLVKINSATAVQTLKANASAMWPKRGKHNRLSPIAKPRLQPQFQLEAGDTIFTIGSCFARNVERELLARGFRLPAMEAIQNDPDFSVFGTGVLNNYGTPSIWNEINWALERDYKTEECFFSSNDKYFDMHLPSGLRPTDLATCQKRRQVITEAYRQIPKCRVVIITLGLSEVWMDTKTGVYLNAPPRRGMMRSEPDRFELHILSFEEVAGFIRDAIKLIQKYGRPDVRILLTVSPVPLTATYRDMDVMQANTYSKAVLRVAAEHMLSEFECVDYYPSYESIMLSERSAAWLDDEVHVQPEIVSVNIGRMVAAYTDSKTMSLDEVRDKILSERHQVIFRILADHPQYLEHRDVVTAYVDAAVQCAEFSEAEKWIDRADDHSGLLAAYIALSKGEYDKVLDLLSGKHYLPHRWYLVKMKALIALEDMEGAKANLKDWTKSMPASYNGYALMGAAITDPAESIEYWERARELSGRLPKLEIEYAEHLVQIGEKEKAREVAQNIDRETAHIVKRVEAILAAV